MVVTTLLWSTLPGLVETLSKLNLLLSLRAVAAATLLAIAEVMILLVEELLAQILLPKIPMRPLLDLRPLALRETTKLPPILAAGIVSIGLLLTPAWPVPVANIELTHRGLPCNCLRASPEVSRRSLPPEQFPFLLFPIFLTIIRQAKIGSLPPLPLRFSTMNLSPMWPPRSYLTSPSPKPILPQVIPLTPTTPVRTCPRTNPT